MGIPGLLTAAKQRSKPKELEFFFGQHFYIDGMNLVYFLCDNLSKRKKAAVYEDFKKQMILGMRWLLRLRPSKVAFYFDAMIPVAKIPLRLRRKEQKLKKATTREVLCAYDLMVDILKEAYPFVQIVYTSIEAEDEIIKDTQVAVSEPNARRQFIFSNDSDIFTFNMTNAHLVNVIPLAGAWGKRADRVDVVNLEDVLKSVPMVKKFLREPPMSREGVRIDNPKYSGRTVLEFVNTGITQNEFISFPILIAPVVSRPHDIGLEIRRAFYGLIFQNNFNGKVYDVVEYCQNDLAIEKNMVTPITGMDLVSLQRVLQEVPIPLIIRNQFERISPAANLNDAHLDAVCAYVGDLIAGNPKPYAERLHRKANTVDAYLKALLAALYTFNNAMETPRDMYRLLWNVSPHGISTYLFEQSDV